MLERTNKSCREASENEYGKERGFEEEKSRDDHRMVRRCAVLQPMAAPLPPSLPPSPFPRVL